MFLTVSFVKRGVVILLIFDSEKCCSRKKSRKKIGVLCIFRARKAPSSVFNQSQSWCWLIEPRTEWFDRWSIQLQSFNRIFNCIQEKEKRECAHETVDCSVIEQPDLGPIRSSTQYIEEFKKIGGKILVIQTYRRFILWNAANIVLIFPKQPKRRLGFGSFKEG